MAQVDYQDDPYNTYEPPPVYEPPPPAAPAPSYTDASLQDTRTQADRIAAGDSPQGSTQYTGTSGRIDVAAGINPADVEKQLREAAAAASAQYGYTSDLYNASDLEGVLRNTGYDVPTASLDEMLRRARETYMQRAASGGDRDSGGYSTDLPDPSLSELLRRIGSGTSGTSTASRTGSPYPYAGGTFSDPWTAQLEALITGQLNALTNPDPNSAQSQLQNFLMKRFGELSNNPGYSTAEQALLNTQAFEPIESMRNASNRRAIERASARGFLPSSGLTYQTESPYGGNESLDTTYDRMRTVANRDLAINNINKRNADLTSAAQIGTAAQSNEQSVRNQALQLATLLYQLPINAQNQALAVINGTGSPVSLLPYIMQMAQSNQANSANFWGSIGSLAGLF